MADDQPKRLAELVADARRVLVDNIKVHNPEDKESITKHTRSAMSATRDANANNAANFIRTTHFAKYAAAHFPPAASAEAAAASAEAGPAASAEAGHTKAAASAEAGKAAASAEPGPAASAEAGDTKAAASADMSSEVPEPLGKKIALPPAASLKRLSSSVFEDSQVLSEESS